MKIGVACDHAGFDYKEKLKEYLSSKGNKINDYGCYSLESVDYPDFAHKLAESIENNENVLVELIKHPEENYEQKFLMNDFKKAIILLPERCRVIFILSRYHNFKYEEIAETLELSIQTVKNQMNKSLSILRKHLNRYID